MNRVRKKITERLRKLGVDFAPHESDAKILLMSSQYLDEYEPFLFEGGREHLPNPFKPWFSLPLNHSWREFHRERGHKWADVVLGVLGEVKV